jgi:hypothetical protein
MNHRLRRQPGQALIAVVIFITLLFIFVGLAIDGGMLYLERRQLQNVADAACLAAVTEFGLGNANDADAVNAAYNYIINNIDENAKIAFDLTGRLNTSYIVNDNGVPDGQNLTRGIEVSGTNVRVAVSFPAYTYFMRLGGIETYDVMARAHCGSTEGGGIWPVAIVRFPGYRQNNTRVGVANTGAPLPQTYGGGQNPPYLIVKDILQRESQNAGVLNDGPVATSDALDCSSRKRNWYDWPSLGNPTSGTGPYRNPTPGCVATVDQPGIEVEMAGQNANPNVGDNSYTGPLLLDARQISFTPRLFYNGQSESTSLNAWKDTIVKYVLTQYPGPHVIPGQQIGLVSGVNTGNVLDAIDDRYQGNGKDIVTALVYNGQVYQDPDFQIRVTCRQGTPGCNNNGSNNGKLVIRNREPTTNFFNSACTQYSGEWYIADGADPTFAAATPKPVPAEYIVRLSPVTNNAAASTIRLYARPSGANVGTGGEAGAPEDYGDLKVRWEWQDASGTQRYYPSSTGWADPSDTVDVDMPLAGVNVTLKVIQSATEERECIPSPSDPLNPSVTITVPKRVAGAQVIQVVGQSVGGAATSRWHSASGELGMRANASSPHFNAGDYYLSFIADPSGIVKNVNPQISINPKLQLNDANSSSGNAFNWSQMTNAHSIVWYKDGTRLTGAPVGISAQLGNSGQDPTLNIQVTPGTVQVGEYDIDLQVQGLSTAQRTHSVRFHLRVESELNASIDSWVVALCYVNFKITTNLSQPSTPNTIMGRAVSGCLNPTQIGAGLTSRLIPW